MCALEQHAVELILARSFMSNLASPAFLIDAEGSLVFFNEPAEAMLGLHFSEAGNMHRDDWGTRFSPAAPDGSQLTVDELAIVRALDSGQPVHETITFVARTGTTHEIEVSAFPILGNFGKCGAMAIFWTAGA